MLWPGGLVQPPCQNTRPTGFVFWEKILLLARFQATLGWVLAVLPSQRGHCSLTLSLPWLLESKGCSCSKASHWAWLGQLKLSINVRGRDLTLYVMEAKGLMGKEYRICDSFVKMSIVPDTDRRCRQKTKTVPDNKNPVFHEHFLFPLQDEDERKRLLITAWNQPRYSRQSELIGCMSFGVKTLLSPDKEISGWYYLLGEDLGRTKHLKVAARRLKQSGELMLAQPAPLLGSQRSENAEQLKADWPDSLLSFMDVKFAPLAKISHS
ncbi:UNVERIFIED_CONTAM: hypothetical protein K2H54_041380 [Gekko kuhli]